MSVRSSSTAAWVSGFMRLPPIPVSSAHGPRGRARFVVWAGLNSAKVVPAPRCLDFPGIFSALAREHLDAL
jgi:hypothetical protein